MRLYKEIIDLYIFLWGKVDDPVSWNDRTQAEMYAELNNLIFPSIFE